MTPLLIVLELRMMEVVVKTGAMICNIPVPIKPTPSFLRAGLKGKTSEIQIKNIFCDSM